MIPPLWRTPSLAFHRSLPVLASSACSQPRVGNEHEAASGREQARQRRLGEVHRPGELAGDRVTRVDGGRGILSPGGSLDLEGRANVELRPRARSPAEVLDDIKIHAPLVADLIIKAGLRISSCRPF